MLQPVELGKGRSMWAVCVSHHNGSVGKNSSMLMDVSRSKKNNKLNVLHMVKISFHETLIVCTFILINLIKEWIKLWIKIFLIIIFNIQYFKIIGWGVSVLSEGSPMQRAGKLEIGTLEKVSYNSHRQLHHT